MTIVVTRTMKKHDMTNVCFETKMYKHCIDQSCGLQCVNMYDVVGSWLGVFWHSGLLVLWGWMTRPAYKKLLSDIATLSVHVLRHAMDASIVKNASSIFNLTMLDSCERFGAFMRNLELMHRITGKDPVGMSWEFKPGDQSEFWFIVTFPVNAPKGVTFPMGGGRSSYKSPKDSNNSVVTIMKLSDCYPFDQPIMHLWMFYCMARLFHRPWSNGFSSICSLLINRSQDVVSHFSSQVASSVKVVSTDARLPKEEASCWVIDPVISEGEGVHADLQPIASNMYPAILDTLDALDACTEGFSGFMSFSADNTDAVSSTTKNSLEIFIDMELGTSGFFKKVIQLSNNTIFPVLLVFQQVYDGGIKHSDAIPPSVPQWAPVLVMNDAETRHAGTHHSVWNKDGMVGNCVIVSVKNPYKSSSPGVIHGAMRDSIFQLARDKGLHTIGLETCKGISRGGPEYPISMDNSKWSLLRRSDYETQSLPDPSSQAPAYSAASSDMSAVSASDDVSTSAEAPSGPSVVAMVPMTPLQRNSSMDRFVISSRRTSGKEPPVAVSQVPKQATMSSTSTSASRSKSSSAARKERTKKWKQNLRDLQSGHIPVSSVSSSEAGHSQMAAAHVDVPSEASFPDDEYEEGPMHLMETVLHGELFSSSTSHTMQLIDGVEAIPGGKSPSDLYALMGGESKLLDQLFQQLNDQFRRSPIVYPCFTSRTFDTTLSQSSEILRIVKNTVALCHFDTLHASGFCSFLVSLAKDDPGSVITLVSRYPLYVQTCSAFFPSSVQADGTVRRGFHLGNGKHLITTSLAYSIVRFLSQALEMEYKSLEFMSDMTLSFHWVDRDRSVLHSDKMSFEDVGDRIVFTCTPVCCPNSRRISTSRGVFVLCPLQDHNSCENAGSTCVRVESTEQGQTVEIGAEFAFWDWPGTLVPKRTVTVDAPMISTMPVVVPVVKNLPIGVIREFIRHLVDEVTSRYAEAMSVYFAPFQLQHFRDFREWCQQQINKHMMERLSSMCQEIIPMTSAYSHDASSASLYANIFSCLMMHFDFECSTPKKWKTLMQQVRWHVPDFKVFASNFSESNCVYKSIEDLDSEYRTLMKRFGTIREMQRGCCKDAETYTQEPTSVDMLSDAPKESVVPQSQFHHSWTVKPTKRIREDTDDEVSDSEVNASDQSDNDDDERVDDERDDDDYRGGKRGGKSTFTDSLSDGESVSESVGSRGSSIHRTGLIRVSVTESRPLHNVHQPSAKRVRRASVSQDSTLGLGDPSPLDVSRVSLLPGLEGSRGSVAGSVMMHPDPHAELDLPHHTISPFAYLQIVDAIRSRHPNRWMELLTIYMQQFRSH